MIICSNCQSKQLDGAIFCLECGASLLAGEGHETTRQLPNSGGVTVVSAAEAGVPQPAAGATITLLVAASGRRITLDLMDELLIGRSDAARGIHPDVDLSPDGGYDAGVSRRHAILAFRDGICTVEDLGSSNGTFVNGKRLAPQAAVPLTNGDELVCGTLRLHVQLP
ncbi:MAG TPA: FHA domain-containing protein [Roseiflexaceae bacterium]|nr:FHA domain-containing protein [Roseiflexaceae bacterium]